jgi:hypothetical protein
MPVDHRQFHDGQVNDLGLLTHRLQDLISIRPAALRDFDLLGIHSVKQLARQNPQRLYQKLCRVTGQSVDICCQDVFSAAIAQARNPLLPRRTMPVVVLEPSTQGWPCLLEKCLLKKCLLQNHP